MPKFEAHITFPREDSPTLRKAMVGLQHWHYSAFDADPLMGDKPFAYLTAYDESGTGLLARMNAVAKECEAAGCTVLRKKIERIVYDTKTDYAETEAMR